MEIAQHPQKTARLTTRSRDSDRSGNGAVTEKIVAQAKHRMANTPNVPVLDRLRSRNHWSHVLAARYSGSRMPGSGPGTASRSVPM
jgi:hypothetical protein